MPFPLFVLCALWAAVPQSSQAGAPRAGAGQAFKTVRMDLVGVPSAGAPHFRFLSVLQQGQDVRVAIDPARHPDLIGKLGQVHVVAARDAAQWDSDPTLVDLTGAPTPFTLQAGSIAANVVTVDAGTLTGSAGDT
ncbi:MAG TPA: hypothetical protein VMT18_15890, partial [Planctomycetota bacterium]|nr:hypothetical protein [Planctomycetota bacterium]